MTVGPLKKLLTFLNIQFIKVQKNIVEISWIKNPNLPFNFNTEEGAILIGAFLSDGTNTSRVMYKNSDMKMLEKVETSARKLLGNNITVDFRLSEYGVPMIFLPNIFGRALSKIHVPRGKKVKINPHVPETIIDGDFRIQASYLRQVFDDESEVNVANRRIVLYRGVEVTDLLPKKFLTSLEIGKSYCLSKISNCIRKILSTKPPNLLIGESKILLKFGINNRYKLRKIIFQKSGYATVIWNLTVSEKYNLKLFGEIIGFTMKSKNESFDKILNSYTKRSCDFSIYLRILESIKTEIEKKGFFQTKDITSATGLSYNSVKKRINRLKRLNKVSIIEPGKYIVDENVRNRVDRQAIEWEKLLL